MASPKHAVTAILLLQGLVLVLGNARCLDDHCAVCSARTGVCITCQRGYKLLGDAGNKYCACRDNKCNLCNSNGTCKQCFVGFGLGPKKHCRTCAAPHCTNCLKNFAKCVECTPGYVLTPRNKCKACPTGCSACNTQGRCSACSDGYGLKGGKCVACADKNCRTCPKSVSKCTECAPTYGLVGGKCKACTDPNCLTCNGKPSYCTSCRGNRYYAKDGKCVL